MSDDGYYWVKSSSHNPLPDYAVRAGIDTDGSAMYIGRAIVNGEYCPAKVVPARRHTSVPYNGLEKPVHDFEVLCETKFDWVLASGGNVAPNAICGGRAANGERLYIGRTHHKGSNTVGKVHPSHKCLYIPYDGKELKFETYEILVRI